MTEIRVQQLQIMVERARKWLIVEQNIDRKKSRKTEITADIKAK